VGRQGGNNECGGSVAFMQCCYSTQIGFLQNFRVGRGPPGHSAASAHDLLSLFPCHWPSARSPTKWASGELKEAAAFALVLVLCLRPVPRCRQTLVWPPLSSTTAARNWPRHHAFVLAIQQPDPASPPRQNPTTSKTRESKRCAPSSTTTSRKLTHSNHARVMPRPP
jgi:hypothetical protein